jgi:hypothetical protein
MTRCRPIALLAAMLILGVSATADAIAQKATVEGHARAEEGAPVQFALVRLVRADSSPLPSDNPPQGITNADGRYRYGLQVVFSLQRLAGPEIILVIVLDVSKRRDGDDAMVIGAERCPCKRAGDL